MNRLKPGETKKIEDKIYVVTVCPNKVLGLPGLSPCEKCGVGSLKTTLNGNCCLNGGECYSHYYCPCLNSIGELCYFKEVNNGEIQDTDGREVPLDKAG